LTPAIVDAIERTTAEIWPGVPVVPALLVATSDGRLLNNAGIWTYGASGMFAGVEGTGAHGLNEHIRVKSLYDGFDFLYRLGKRLALD
jgi:acetylornithine deacetylase/succinyl-diaminopimelate desuccinylase-like protein